MKSLMYTCATTGESVVLDGSDDHVFFGTVPKLRGYEWSYTLGSKSVTGLHTASREVTATGRVSGSLDSIDHMHQLFEADLRNNTPGTLTSDNEWQAKAYVAKAEPGNIYPAYVLFTWTIVLVDSTWTRESTTRYVPRDDSEQLGLDYPHDYPFDYAGMPPNQSIVNDALTEMPCKLTVFGVASNPTIRIGDNTYQVNCEVPKGSRLVIDGAASPKTVKLIDLYGNETNELPNALRGSGKGGGNYVFQPLPAGSTKVSWAGGFEFDLTVCEQRGEPKWN